MARCCGDTCNCKVTVIDDAGGNPLIQVTGTGTTTDPFVFEVLALNIADSTSIDLSLTWVDDDTGYQLTAAFAASSTLDMIGDVNAPAPTNNQVLGFDTATGKWTPRAPTTAPTGAVTHDTSLTGDGSGGDPLAVAFAADGGIEDAGAGVTLTDGTLNALVAHYTDATARAAAALAPVLGTLSTLDDNPGMVDYWDGSDWLPLIRVTSIEAGTGGALIETSGPYAGGPVKILTRSLAVSTDSLGLFQIMDSTELATYAGILSISIQPVVSGADTPWGAVYSADDPTSLNAWAYALDGSGAIGSNIVSLVATIYAYL